MFLKKMGFKPDKTIVSAAKRTRQTALELSKHLDIKINQAEYLEELYECSAEVLRKVIEENIHRVNSLLLIGHNPSITDYVNQISLEYIPNIPTTGCVGITIHPDKACVDFMVFPKQLKNL